MRSLLLAVAAFSAAAVATEMPARQPDVIGQAYGRDSGVLLYSERHFCTEDKRRCDIHYLDTEGDVFAHKQLDYRSSLKSPALRMQDFRSELDVEVNATEDPQWVVDAGFDNYVRLRWEELSSGAEVRFPFLIAGRDKPLAMRAGAGDQAECEPDRLCLQIELDSWLLGMLVAPFKLSYDRDSRRLLRFSGLSNIKDMQGRPQNVEIVYQYPQ